MATQSDPVTPGFLLMEGGPLYHIEQRLVLARGRETAIRRRAILSILLTWVPLFVLCAAQGTAYGNHVELPFLKDFSAYARFLLAIPLLIGAEAFLGPRIAEAAEHFVTSGLVLPRDYEHFDHAVRRGLRLRDSVPAEIIILVLAYAISITASHQGLLHLTTWRTVQTAAGVSNTWAGWWFFLFCTPLLQFLLLRWFWRLFLWFQFLTRMRNLKLQLFPTHPDEAAGLGFVGEAQRFFGSLLFAYSIAVSGVLANQIVYGGATLKHFAVPIAIYTLLSLLLVLGPLVIFTGTLIRTKRQGLHQYGTLSTTYTGSFHRKWIQGENESHEPLLGTGDIQSLADLGNSYSFIARMNAVPVDPRTLLNLLVATLLPMTPLLFTMMSPLEIAKLLLKVLV
jgi:hypothetical protein